MSEVGNAVIISNFLVFRIWFLFDMHMVDTTPKITGTCQIAELSIINNDLPKISILSVPTVLLYQNIYSRDFVFCKRYQDVA